MNVLPLALAALLALVASPLSEQGNHEDPEPKSFYESELENDRQLGFYRCFDAMVEDKEFRLGRMEYDVFPSVVKASDIKDFLSGSTSLLHDFGVAKEAYFLDHPAPLSVDVDAISLSVGTKGESYAVSIGTGRRENYLLEGYAKNETETEAAESLLKATISSIAAEAEGKSDVEKARFAAEAIAKKATYGFAENDPSNAPFIRNAYGALVNGVAVCEGYAKAYRSILDAMGIPCVLVNGYLLSGDGSYEPHLWTDVQIDGSWYAVDPTLYDSLGEEKAFLLDFDTLRRDHLEDGMVGESSFVFSYPSLSTNPYGVNPLPVEVGYEGEDDKKVFRATFSFDGKNATALAEEGKYLAVSYSTQTSVEENIRWTPYASLSGMLQFEHPVVVNEGNSTFFYDWGSVPYLRFALLSIAPSEGIGSASYPADLPASAFLSKSDIIVNQAYAGDVARPFASEVSPANEKKLDILSSYKMEFTYNEPLERVDKETKEGVLVETTHGLTEKDYRLDDVRFEEDTNTLRFNFRPSDSFLADGEVYSFTPTNLVGKESGKVPHPVTYTFSYSSVVCSKILPQGRLYMDVLAHPSLIDNEDLSLAGWDFEGKPVSDSFVSQLALVATGIGKGDASAMIDATGLVPFSSSTYELSLHLCGLPQGIPEGSYMRVSFGFPEGYDPSMEGTTFKLFHFKRNAAGDIYPESAEEIPCLITDKGIVAEIPSFSPFLLVETRKGEETKKTLYTRVSSGKGTAKEKDTGHSLVTVGGMDDVAVLLTPKEGNAATYALLNGNYLDLEGNEVTLLSEELEANNVLEVGFASEEKLAREKAQGIKNLDGTFLSSLKGVDPIDKKTRILMWTLVPILGVIASIAAIIFLVEFRKRKNLSEKKKKPSKHE